MLWFTPDGLIQEVVAKDWVSAFSADAAVKEDDLPLPLEYLAVTRELLLAYKLLAEHGNLKVRGEQHRGKEKGDQGNKTWKY
jgi:hypothetical protein